MKGFLPSMNQTTHNFFKKVTLKDKILSVIQMKSTVKSTRRLVRVVTKTYIAKDFHR